MRLLTRALMAAALLGGVGGALSAGSAQAATGCGVQISWADWVGGTALTCDDKQFTYVSTTNEIIGDLASSVVSADEPLTGDYLFNLDFLDLPGGESSTTIPFDFTYAATITDPARVFTAVDLDSNADTFANPASDLTTTFTFAGGNSPITLTSTNGSASVASVTGGPQTIIVRNLYDGDGTIDSFQNSFQQSSRVPGPLPLLGAGMAFGFTRKLRRRIQGQHVTT